MPSKIFPLVFRTIWKTRVVARVTTMNTFSFDFANTKSIPGPNSKDVMSPIMGIFSPNQSNETGLEFSVLEEKPSNISERTITTSKQEESQEATLLEESLLKLSDTEVNYVSPYFSDEPKIKDRKADNSLVDCEKSQPTDGNSVQSTGVTDQQNRITRTAGKCRKLREIGTYDANLVEKEFQNLVHQLNLKRQHDAETFQQFSQSLRMKVPIY